MKISNLIIDKVVLKKKRYPLKAPYVLSFTTLYYFDSFQIIIILENGEKNTAEVVPLPGYNNETAESILNYLNKMKVKLIGLSLKEARLLVEKDIPENPFRTTAILTAIDMFLYPINNNIKYKDIYFVSPTSTKDFDKFKNDIEQYLSLNKLIKVKLTGDLQQDIYGLDFLSTLADELCEKIRLDANQKYTFEDALKLLSYLSKKNSKNFVAYLEQPLAAGEWDAHYQLQKRYPEVAIMLDESIVTLSDVEKAYLHKIPFIKLKLFKQGGIYELLALAEKANQLDIKVVLGNGVATEISNKIEIYLHQNFFDLFFGASEANGFMKIKYSNR